MPATTTIFRAARPVFNQSAFATQARQAFSRTSQQHTGFRFSQNTYGGSGSRRWQSSAAGDGAAKPSWFQMMWDSPVGIKTVHFWAPVMKWALVLAGISDLSRPAEKLSVTQNGALTATGLIWTRWCFVIRPKNYLYVFK
jgi:mitochondrial pyruvate carrier 2